MVDYASDYGDSYSIEIVFVALSMALKDTCEHRRFDLIAFTYQNMVGVTYHTCTCGCDDVITPRLTLLVLPVISHNLNLNRYIKFGNILALI